jgi:hypothetical protein
MADFVPMFYVTEKRVGLRITQRFALSWLSKQASPYSPRRVLPLPSVFPIVACGLWDVRIIP